MNASHKSQGLTTIVLIGGGHTHVQVLRSFGARPWPGVRLVLIAKELHAPYSGMLPGLISGRYAFEECHIDLARLAKFAGAQLIHDEADGLDRRSKTLNLKSNAPVDYDIASVDVGITPKLDSITGASDYGIAVKPISTFWPKWQAAREVLAGAHGTKNIVIVGAGAAGFELSLAVDHKLNRDRSPPDAFSVSLISSEHLLPTHNLRAQKLARRALQARSITVYQHDRVVAVAPQSVTLKSGKTLPSDATLVTTGAAAPTWFANTDLATTKDGYLATRDTLQVINDRCVFAVGDCATTVDYPREKSGVFAVRQGPPLTQNLNRVARGEQARPYTPQTYFLTLLSLANGRAIAAKGPFAAAGAWAWKLKDHIDQKFMRRFQDLPDKSRL